MTAALKSGAEDILTHDDGSIEVVTTPEDFVDTKEAMIAEKLIPENAEITMTPSVTVSLGLEDAEKIIALVDMLEELDDVQSVYTNAEFSEDVLAQL